MLPSFLSIANSSSLRYKIIDIGLPPGATYIDIAHASDDFKTIVGCCMTKQGDRAFRWENGRFSILSKLWSIGNNVNKKGLVVGWVSLEQIKFQAAFWNNGREQIIFDDTRGSTAVAVDDDGNIYGNHTNPQYIGRGFIRRPNGQVEGLKIPGDDANSVFAVNNKGKIAFTITKKGGKKYRHDAGVYYKGKISYLSPLIKGQSCLPCAINERDEVAGMGWLSEEGSAVPVVWKKGIPHAVAIPDGATGTASVINQQGDVGGSVTVRNGSSPAKRLAFIVQRDVFYYLNDVVDKSITSLERIHSMDARGNILCSGETNGLNHFFLLKSIT